MNIKNLRVLVREEIAKKVLNESRDMNLNPMQLLEFAEGWEVLAPRRREILKHILIIEFTNLDSDFMGDITPKELTLIQGVMGDIHPKLTAILESWKKLD